MSAVGDKSRRAPRVLALVWLCVLTPLSIFYLFFLPAIIASRAQLVSAGTIVFSGFMYLQLWMLALEVTYSSAARLYGLKRRTLFRFMNTPDWFVLRSAGARTAGLSCLFSYLLTIYGFSIAYVYLSAINHHAFNCGQLGIFDAFYFSLITAATIGYGDICPVSTGARTIVMWERNVASVN